MGNSARLPVYTNDDETVYASKITAIDYFDVPVIGRCVKLTLDIGKVANLIPSWVEQNAPEVGGYFVLSDNAIARYLSAEEFDGIYSLH